MDFIDIRVWFTKKGDIKFISHLDLNRFMQRALKRAKLPLWHTEGFSPHPYVTFALPLSLGQESECEVLDFRLVTPMAFEEIKHRMQEAFPVGMEVIKVATPVKKAKEIAWAGYEITLLGLASLKDAVTEFLCKPEIKVTKRTKKGGESTVDLAPHLKDVSVNVAEGSLKISLKMPSGSTLNLNPSLLMGALQETLKMEQLPLRIVRTGIYTENGEEFR